MTETIIGAFFDVYNEVRSGLRDSRASVDRATGLQVGLILTFGPKAQIKRLIYARKDEAPVQS